ncbi:hypothetical protein Lser_V15G22337 [Lactuca serriola]
MLHVSHPFSRETSHLASIYHQVYLDFGLAIPKLSVDGMISTVKELLELAPIKKVMFNTDGYAFPETFYLGEKRALEVVFSVLRDACNEGDLSIPEALEAVTDIFSENSKKFYKIDSDATSRVLRHVFDTLKNSNNQELNSTQQEIVLVRVLWIDASRQHRCRHALTYFATDIGFVLYLFDIAIIGGKPLLKLNKILRPGGVFICSATPVYRDDERDKKPCMAVLTESIC